MGKIIEEEIKRKEINFRDIIRIFCIFFLISANS